MVRNNGAKAAGKELPGGLVNEANSKNRPDASAAVVREYPLHFEGDIGPSHHSRYGGWARRATPRASDSPSEPESFTALAEGRVIGDHSVRSIFGGIFGGGPARCHTDGNQHKHRA